ncbi:hypothetical protein vseg_008092 [Gypsophila vaccaria]
MEVLNGVVGHNNSSILTKLNKTHVKKSCLFNELTPKLQFFCKIGGEVGEKGEKMGKLGLKVVKLGYENKGHLEYYGENKKKGKNEWSKVSSKKKMKLLKGLSEDLSTFSGFGFGLNLDGSDEEDKSVIVSKAAEVLLAQLKQLKLEEEKQKKKEKEEKKNKKCKNDVDSSSSSSSESSESSDSECDEVVDLKRMRSASLVAPIETNETSSIPTSKGLMNDQMSTISDQSCCNMILETTLTKHPTIDVLNANTVNLNIPNEGKKIEVCMGGKCKKSGAPALIDAFQNAIGDEGVVVGCKCMGKCKSAPNVKLSNGVGESFGDDSLRTPSNPLYIGVGLEDVELIMSSYFGNNQSIAAVAS